MFRVHDNHVNWLKFQRLHFPLLHACSISVFNLMNSWRPITPQIQQIITQSMQRKQPSNLRLKIIHFNDWKAENSEQGFSCLMSVLAFPHWITKNAITIWAESSPSFVRIFNIQAQRCEYCIARIWMLEVHSNSVHRNLYWNFEMLISHFWWNHITNCHDFSTNFTSPNGNQELQ